MSLRWASAVEGVRKMLEGEALSKRWEERNDGDQRWILRSANYFISSKRRNGKMVRFGQEERCRCGSGGGRGRGRSGRETRQ